MLKLWAHWEDTEKTSRVQGTPTPLFITHFQGLFTHGIHNRRREDYSIDSLSIQTARRYLLTDQQCIPTHQPQS